MHRNWQGLFRGFQGIVLAAAAASPWSLRGADTPWRLLSAHSNVVAPLRSAGGDSGGAAFSGDGRYVTFVSSADNLVTNCSNGLITDVYVGELETGQIALVSVSTNKTNGGNGSSSTPVISRDGRFVAFVSAATDLAASGGVASEQVFVRDLVKGITTLVSASKDGNGGGNGNSGSLSISDDGQRIAFESAASNLVANDRNDQKDIFLRDLNKRVTGLISADASGQGAGLGGPSFNPQMNRDGSVVVFQSYSTNLTNLDVPPYQLDLFLRRVDAGVTERLRISGPFDNTISGFSSTAFQLSRDGRFLVSMFGSLRDLFWLDLQTATSVQISFPTNSTSITNLAYFQAGNLTISEDGQIAAFEAAYFSATSLIGIWRSSGEFQWLQYPDAPESPALDVSAPVLSPDGSHLAFVRWTTNDFASSSPSGRYDLYDCTLSNGVVKLILGQSSAAQGTELRALSPVFDPSGQYLAFESASPTLVMGDSNDASDLFLRDLATGETKLLSGADTSSPSLSGAGQSWLAPNSLSTNGLRVVLTSSADDLVPNDSNGQDDVFVYDLERSVMMLVSVSTNGFSGNGASTAPALSANGRFVAFVSKATDLAPGASARDNVFLRDLEQGTTRLLSGPSLRPATSLVTDFGPTISADGQRVAWVAETSTAPTNMLVVVDATTGTVTTVSDRNLVAPVLSASGERVSFFTSTSRLGDAGNPQILEVSSGLAQPVFYQNARAPRMTPSNFSWDADGSHSLATYALSSRDWSQAYWRDEKGVELTVVLFWLGQVLSDVNITSPRMSENGRYGVVVVTKALGSGPDTLPESSIFWCDLRGGTSRLVTVRSDGFASANGPSSNPSISADGRYVLFRSDATDLVPDDNLNSHPALYFRDMQTGVTRRLGPSTILSSNTSPGPAFLSANATTLVFDSLDSDLSAGDANQSADVFAWQFETPAPRLPKFFPVQLSGKNLVLSWDNGVLQMAPGVEGPWTDLPSATSPYPFLIEPMTRAFFQVRQ